VALPPVIWVAGVPERANRLGPISILPVVSVSVPATDKFPFKSNMDAAAPFIIKLPAVEALPNIFSVLVAAGH
jgi:hypothetical protein